MSTPRKQMKPYLERLRQAGAEPVELGPESLPTVELFSRRFQGLLLTGGPDLDWRLYSDRRHPETGEPDEERDEMELALVRAALERDMPVLAICRGVQALNVALSGKLVQHLEGHCPQTNGDSAWVRAFLVPGTRLAELLGPSEHLLVNCRHHQAVDEEAVAPGLVVTARAEDGTIEALESPSHRWVVGVQWHPERAEASDAFLPLFADFVRAADSHNATYKPDYVYGS